MFIGSEWNYRRVLSPTASKSSLVEHSLTCWNWTDLFKHDLVATPVKIVCFQAWLGCDSCKDRLFSSIYFQEASEPTCKDLFQLFGGSEASQDFPTLGIVFLSDWCSMWTHDMSPSFTTTPAKKLIEVGHRFPWTSHDVPRKLCSWLCISHSISHSISRYIHYIILYPSLWLVQSCKKNINKKT